MRFILRPALPVIAVALAIGVLLPLSAEIAGAATPTVTIYDNDAPPPSRGFDIAQAGWGFAPAHIEVKKGDSITFVNGGKKPHTVTSISLPGPIAETAFGTALVAGGVFDSSPAREGLIAGTGAADEAGKVKMAEWKLDTSGLSAGHYVYYCRIHPWMVGSLSVIGE
ncbi:MAG: plastocyanin/azurin family copper-binding protein [Chloroflexota bacterium]